MFSKNGILYADVYKYLKHKKYNLVALSVKGRAEDYEEISMDLPLIVKVENGIVKWQDGLLACVPEKIGRDVIKRHVIKSRYSYDDQIAILLNKERSEEDALAYNRMQEWREFAAEIARKVE